VIVDAHAARPLAQGLVKSPQQQQQLHMQVERPIDIAHLCTAVPAPRQGLAGYRPSPALPGVVTPQLCQTVISVGGVLNQRLREIEPAVERLADQVPAKPPDAPTPTPARDVPSRH
jgi:hypothetical protein